MRTVRFDTLSGLREEGHLVTPLILFQYLKISPDDEFHTLAFSCFVGLDEPKKLFLSVTATAGIPAAATDFISGPTRTKPSVSENSECTRR